MNAESPRPSIAPLWSREGLRSFCWGVFKDETKLPFGSHEFRQHFRNGVIGSRNGKAYAIAAFSLIMTVTTVLVLSIHFEPHFLLLFPLYFMICNGAEYLLHRYPMHHKMKGMEVIYEHVTVHHNFYANEHYYYEDPRDYYAVILPIHVFVILTLTIGAISGLIYATVGQNDALFFALIGFGYYAMYEVLHFSYHSGENSFIKRLLPFVKRLSRLHRLHHETNLMAKHNFNITFPVLDRLCKTYYVPR